MAIDQVKFGRKAEFREVGSGASPVYIFTEKKAEVLWEPKCYQKQKLQSGRLSLNDGHVTAYRTAPSRRQRHRTRPGLVLDISPPFSLSGMLPICSITPCPRLRVCINLRVHVRPLPVLGKVPEALRRLMR